MDRTSTERQCSSFRSPHVSPRSSEFSLMSAQLHEDACPITIELIGDDVAMFDRVADKFRPPKSRGQSSQRTDAEEFRHMRRDRPDTSPAFFIPLETPDNPAVYSLGAESADG